MNLGEKRVMSVTARGGLRRVSVALVFEYEAAVMRAESGIWLRHSAISDVLDYVGATAHRQAIYCLWRPTLPDAGDDLVLEVAAHGRCDRISELLTGGGAPANP